MTLTPRAHQLEAIAAIQANLHTTDRVSVLMACGTGKTLVGRWLAQQRRCATTLVVVPSLALIAQTLAEWRSDADWMFEALIICSDPSTADAAKERAGSDGEDIPAPFWARHRAQVTTSLHAASRVMSDRRPDRPLVVFSTYHSAPIAAAAARTASTRFDLTIADEAHNLAGHPRADFRVVLGEELPTNARVFMTATQVNASPAPAQAGWDDWSAPLSMDETLLFGPVVYRLDFAAAIEQGLLSDYEVLIYETPGETAPDPVAALLTAAGTGLSRVLTFHGRVAKARAFADTVDGVRLPDGRRVRAVAVAGADPAIHRSRALTLLEDPDPTTLVVVASARCLAEGVDVPAVDGVLFADPKSSDVGIIQSVGRALRLAPGKSTGKVLIPVCYSADIDEDTTLSNSSFAAVWRILRGLRTLDARLPTELDSLTRTQSRRGREDGSRSGPRVTFDLPSTGDLHCLIARLVENTTTAWDERFAELKAFALEHGTADPPAKNKRLTTWCQYQRKAYRRGMLLPDRAAALRSLPGWTWDAELRAWIEQWKEVHATIPPGGRLDLENRETMTRRLPVTSGCGRNRATTIGRWCAHQRVLARRGDLDTARRNYLKAMPGWTYDALADVDAACLNLLAEYVAWKGHANPPADYVDDDLPVGQWLNMIRRAKVLGTLSQALLDELEATTPNAGSPGTLRWETRETQWQLGLEVLHQYVAREGRCRMPENHMEDFAGIQYPLYVWCRRQRHDHRSGNLDPSRAVALEQVPGWLWEIQPSPRIGIDIGDTRHGTRTGYVKGCRCQPCTDANRHAQSARDQRSRAGGPSTDLVSAARARGHLRILTGQGATQKGLARAADLNVKTIVEILEGDRTRIQPDTERIVLAITMNDVRQSYAPGTLIPAAPTWERITDLVERGWPKSWIAREAGLGNSIQLKIDQVTAGNAARIAQLHAQLDDITPPPRRHRDPMPPLSEITADPTRSA
ncbi:DEAD/DEAH box helicase [Nostocoides sp. F2B08]|uniref:DEAD/DEAH box helicase n=1 Tax=Nostocoides sp. F2B08 TaxID=2653936 RepID=UPI00186B0038|nr:DEAD/DEAH box helicase [Tetrasphaera sp. F2B08]